MNKPNNATSAFGKDTNKLLKARNPVHADYAQDYETEAWSSIENGNQ